MKNKVFIAITAAVAMAAVEETAVTDSPVVETALEEAVEDFTEDLFDESSSGDYDQLWVSGE